MLNSFSVTTPRSLCYQGSLVSADLLLCCEQTGTVVPFAVSRPEPVNPKSHISELCDIYVRRTRLLSVSVNQLATDKSSPTRPEWRSYDALYGSCLLRYFITTLIQKCAFNPEMSVTLSLFQVICDKCIWSYCMLYHPLSFYWKCLELHSLYYKVCVCVSWNTRTVCMTTGCMMFWYKSPFQGFTLTALYIIYLWLWFGITIKVNI